MALIIPEINKQAKQKLLIFGYVTKLEKDPSFKNIATPTDLINLIKSFYDQYTYIYINNMHAFLNTPAGRSLVTVPFSIGDIDFECSIFPNGKKPESKGSVQFYLKVKSLNTNIENITINREWS